MPIGADRKVKTFGVVLLLPHADADGGVGVAKGWLVVCTKIEELGSGSYRMEIDLTASPGCVFSCSIE